MEDAQITHGSSDHAEEDQDYIDLEVGLNSTISNPHIKKDSPPQEAKSEFEFQMFPSSINRDNTFSTADELFYNGKLLPLHHLPLRSQMLDKLHDHRNPNKSLLHVSTSFDDNFEQSLSNPLFQSFHIISSELNPKDYFFDYLSTEDNEVGTKRSWTRKLKLIKHLSFGSKLKCSRYIKSLVNTKPDYCSSKSNVGATSRINIDRGRHRKSFSEAIKRFLTAKPSYSSSGNSSNNSNGTQADHMHLLMRSKNVYLEDHDENPIQAAIAHCKNSQQKKFHSRKSTTVCDLALDSLSASKMISQELDRPAPCRG